MVYTEVRIYGKFDIRIYTLKREMKCLVPLWDSHYYHVWIWFLSAPNLWGSIKPSVYAHVYYQKKNK